MGNEVMIRDEALMPTTFDGVFKLAAALVKSKLLPDAVTTPEAAVLIILKGRELGLPPVYSLANINVIKGKPSLAADLMAALVKRSPVCEYWMLIESTAARAVYETKRRGDPKPTRLEWTIQDAQTAGLSSQQNFRNYPKAMLRARCIAALARAVYPDIVAGIYDPDELADRPASTYVDTTCVETGDTFAPAAAPEPVDPAGARVAWMLADINAAQMQSDLDAIKPSIKALEADHPEGYKRLVSEWQARAKALAPPPSRTDALKARMRKAAAPVEPKTIEIVDADDKPVEAK
jgi:hypothetical protein